MSDVRVSSLLLLFTAIALIPSHAAAQDVRPREPLLRDLLGLCTHTVQFKPELYRPICAFARDYHPIDWDTGPDPATPTTFPFAQNRVQWADLYGRWRAGGFEVLASLMFDQMPPAAWTAPEASARVYGEAFARAFGPTAKGPVAAVEIGNEPGKYSDALYRTIFTGMTAGLRAGDPKLRIATCAADAGPSGDYHKSLACVQGLEASYDIITMHTYAMLQGWPTWQPSHPEDPRIDYLSRVRAVAAWRDTHASGKELWITEFGFDACTRAPDPADKTWGKWQGCTETQQAQWLVRSVLAFAALDVDRAYVFWFDDQDEPQLHGSKGLTRKGVPKPAFHALAHLTRTLGDHRFGRVVVDRPGEAMAIELHADDGRRAWVAWTPTGEGRRTTLRLPPAPGRLVSAERMPLDAGAAPTVAVAAGPAGLELEIDGSPAILRFAP